jgi:hypothetical protein
MPNGSLAPGVRTIEATPVALPPNVGPTLTGILGQASRGRVDTAQVVTRWSEFVSKYGGFTANTDLGIYVRQFFDNGGAACRVLRMCAPDAVAADTGADVVGHNDTACMTVTAQDPGEWGNSLGLKFALQEVLSTEQQAVVDGDGNNLPNTANSASNVSMNTVAVPVSDLTKIGVGDAVNVFNADGSVQFDDVVFCVGIDAAEQSLILEKRASLDVTGAGFYLRTGSQHRLKTFAKEALADGQASLLLDSVAGIKKGSLLTAILYSHCKTIESRGRMNLSKMVVSRVSGNRVYFEAVADNEPNTKDIPATTAAALQYTVSATEYIRFVARDTGPAGNKVAIVINTGAGANAISVNGKTITIDSDDYTCETLATDIAAHTAANALVSATATDSGNDDTVLPDDLTSTRLTGGAQLMVYSQEFGMEVLLGDAVVEKHNYLSMVPTSSDYIGRRLGGDPDTHTPLSGSESGYIIVSDLDATVDAGDTELLTQPRALPSVGFAGGDDGSVLTDGDWIGSDSPLSGARLLASYDDIKLAIAPGVTGADVQKEFARLADESGKFVWLLDPPSDVASAADVMEHRVNDLGLNTSKAQLANTWAVIRDVRSDAALNSTLDCPPTPAWAGLIAQAQAEGGSHRSCGNRLPVGWTQVKFNPGASDHELLNENGVSVFRVAAGALRCYGDRTLLQANDPRKFGNVSRFICQFIHDAEAALAGVVFEPGNETLFGLIESKLTRLLTAAHVAGALYPKTDIKRAFSVACNAETTSPADIAQGTFYAEVALSPATLAERIVLRLQVSAGGVSIA